MTDIWTGISNVLAAPLVGDLDVTHLFLLIGIILIMLVVWAMLFHGLRNVVAGA